MRREASLEKSQDWRREEQEKPGENQETVASEKLRDTAFQGVWSGQASQSC